MDTTRKSAYATSPFQLMEKCPLHLPRQHYRTKCSRSSCTEWNVAGSIAAAINPAASMTVPPAINIGILRPPFG